MSALPPYQNPKSFTDCCKADPGILNRGRAIAKFLAQSFTLKLLTLSTKTKGGGGAHALPHLNPLLPAVNLQGII